MISIDKLLIVPKTWDIEKRQSSNLEHDKILIVPKA